MCSPPNTGTFSLVFTYPEKQAAIQGYTCIIMNNAEQNRPLMLSLAQLIIQPSMHYDKKWKKEQDDIFI
jgi:hypothetical protein